MRDCEGPPRSSAAVYSTRWSQWEMQPHGEYVNMALHIYCLHFTTRSSSNPSSTATESLLKSAHVDSRCWPQVSTYLVSPTLLISLAYAHANPPMHGPASDQSLICQSPSMYEYWGIRQVAMLGSASQGCWLVPHCLSQPKRLSPRLAATGGGEGPTLQSAERRMDSHTPLSTYHQ